MDLGQGEQPLYEVEVSCGEEKETVRCGARTVELRDWRIYLNGERVFMRGINYLPTDALPGPRRSGCARMPLWCAGPA